MRQLDIESLRQQLEYVEDTGWLRWKKNGRIAGCLNKHNYVVVRVNGSLELAHRIIWAIKTGEQPPKLIDHEDTDQSNNKWSNLRANTSSGNGYNRRNVKGVYQVPNGRWAAHYHKHYRKIQIGTFDTKEQAEAAVLDVRSKHLAKELHAAGD